MKYMYVYIKLHLNLINYVYMQRIDKLRHVEMKPQLFLFKSTDTVCDEMCTYVKIHSFFLF